MRRQKFWWTFLVGGIVCFVYGGFTLIYHLNRGNGLKIHALILFILGALALVTFLVLYVLTTIEQKKKEKIKAEEKVEVAEPVIEEKKVEPAPKKEEVPIVKPAPKKDNDVTYVRSRVSYSRYDGGTSYVKLVGSGPILRVDGNRILDMRNNTYYRIEGNIVKEEGSGPVFEISGNRIRSAFGGYLYEISGSNINKVYGGYYASISGGYITTYDLKEKYEITDSLNKNQLLTISALLFGGY